VKRVAAALVVLGSGCSDHAKDAPKPVASLAPSASVAAPPVAARGFLAPTSFADVAKAANPSVVTVNVTGSGSADGEPNPFDGRHRVMQGVGSGFFVDSEGTVLTNHHVVAGLEEADTAAAANKKIAVDIRVKLFDDREFAAEVVGTDARTDLAVLRVRDAVPSRALAFGDSDAIEVGDWVVAIGNPFGLSHTVSAGIVSGKGRSREDVPLDPAGYYDFLQTDASINPGNSGGPLLDLRGQVVGINTAIRGGGAQGIGFAVPIAIVKQLLPTLLRSGSITRSALGVKVRDARELTKEDRARLGLGDAARGAVVEYVSPGGAAAQAKLKVGDVIVDFDGQPIDRATRLQWLASTSGVGKVVTLLVERRSEADAGDRVSVVVTLGELEDPKSKHVAH
jgi:serine protease Do